MVGAVRNYRFITLRLGNLSNMYSNDRLQWLVGILISAQILQGILDVLEVFKQNILIYDFFF